MTLSIADSMRGDFHVLQLAGDIDVETSRTLRAHIVERVTAPSARIVVDLTAVDFMDSSGLGALVSGWQLTREDGDFRIAGANSVVRRVLTITGMEDVFAIYPNVAEALADRT